MNPQQLKVRPTTPITTALLCFSMLLGCQSSDPTPTRAAVINAPSIAAQREAAATQEKTDVAGIQKLYADWRTAVEAADIPSYLKSLDDDVVLMPPGAADIVGANTYAAFLEPVFATATYKIEVTKPQEITVLGNTAIARYDYVIHLELKNPEQQVQEPGALTASRSELKYFDVLKRQQDGSFKVWRHTWNAAPAN